MHGDNTHTSDGFPVEQPSRRKCDVCLGKGYVQFWPREAYAACKGTGIETPAEGTAGFVVSVESLTVLMEDANNGSHAAIAQLADQGFAYTAFLLSEIAVREEEQVAALTSSLEARTIERDDLLARIERDELAGAYAEFEPDLVRDVFQAALAFVAAEQFRLRARHGAEDMRRKHDATWQQQCSNAWVDGCGCLSRSIEGACEFCRPLFEAEKQESASRQESRDRFGDLQSAVYEHYKAIDIAAEEEESSI